MPRPSVSSKISENTSHRGFIILIDKAYDLFAQKDFVGASFAFENAVQCLAFDSSKKTTRDASLLCALRLNEATCIWRRGSAGNKPGVLVSTR